MNFNKPCNTNRGKNWDMTMAKFIVHSDSVISKLKILLRRFLHFIKILCSFIAFVWCTIVWRKFARFFLNIVLIFLVKHIIEKCKTYFNLKMILWHFRIHFIIVNKWLCLFTHRFVLELFHLHRYLQAYLKPSFVATISMHFVNIIFI